MSRLFNGTSDKGAMALDLSAYSVISYSMWLWWGTNANDDDLALETSPTNYAQSSGFICDPNNSVAAGTAFVGLGLVTGSKVWSDRFARPSAATWHHWLVVHDRAAPLNLAWIDGVAQTLTLQTHDAVTYGNFGNLTLNSMCRAGTSLFGSGRMADLAVWGGVQFGTTEAAGLFQGTPPTSYSPSALVGWWKLSGDVLPEPNSYGPGAITLTGTLKSENPPSSFYRAPIPGAYSISGLGAN